MSDKYFLDTNIFVYSFDKSERKKQKIAFELIGSALESNLGVISYQVVQEFLNVALNKFERPISSEDALKYLNGVLMPLCEMFPSIPFCERSLSVKAETGFSFFDSLIVAAAIDTKCSILYSEDLQHDRTIRGTKIYNPFIR